MVCMPPVHSKLLRLKFEKLATGGFCPQTVMWTMQAVPKCFHNLVLKPYNPQAPLAKLSLLQGKNFLRNYQICGCSCAITPMHRQRGTSFVAY